jgi:hypothetical protein
MANGILKQLNQSLALTQQKGLAGLKGFPLRIASASGLLATPPANDVCENHPPTKPVTNNVPD